MNPAFSVVFYPNQRARPTIMLWFLFILSLWISPMTLAHQNTELQQAYLNKGADYVPRTRHLQDNKPIFTNHLILANSPYLLQHAHNPVRWHSFNDEAFALAKKQNKMIFLSIGYATCHWCHVMEEESFEDLDVADFLNQHFVAIKVDREVNPDVDNHFMNIAQLLTGAGGWPLNVILTPDGAGFYAGTYFPKAQLLSVLGQIEQLWRGDRGKIIAQAQEIKRAMSVQKSISSALPDELQTLAVKQMLTRFDEFYGGFGDAPKFPGESGLLMLIDQQMKRPNPEQLNAIITTLDTMASGGLYDVVAGGFHRYSTDERWLVPHFEKMLYNQAQLTQVYAKAYQLTGRFFYKNVAEKTLDYVLSSLKIDGGFASATDADSEGEEGIYFTWTKDELKQTLDTEFATLTRYFDLSDNSEFEDRHIIRYRDVQTLSQSDLSNTDKILAKLLKQRNSRVPPLTDYKILLSWNAMLLKSLVVAGELLDEKYQIEAQNLATFLHDNFGLSSLKRVKIKQEVSGEAITEDYIYLADAYLALFDQNNQEIWLKRAQDLTDLAYDKFWDKTNKGFNISNNKRINNREQEIYDGVIPSSNGLAYSVLNRLSDRLKDPIYAQYAQELLHHFSGKIIQNPSIYSNIVRFFDDNKHGKLSKEVYAYNGKLKITSYNNKLVIDLTPGWHINASKVLQSGLIATKVEGNNIEDIQYPDAKLTNLGFSKEKLAVYEHQAIISYNRKNNDFSTGTLTFQACSDKVCLAPQTIKVIL